MAQFVDFMISKERGLPPNGMEVLIRYGNGKDISPGVFEGGEFHGVPKGEAISWLPKQMKNPCPCEVLRWKNSKKSGKCPKCGIRWRKVK